MCIKWCVAGHYTADVEAYRVFLYFSDQSSADPHALKRAVDSQVMDHQTGFLRAHRKPRLAFFNKIAQPIMAP